MNVVGEASARADWTRGAARGFAAVVLVSLVALGIWIDRSGRGRESASSLVGREVSVADLAAGGHVEPVRSDPGAVDGGLLDLNLASAAQLELLPGIGPAGAARIVEYREQIGGFRSVDELGGVKGIGDRTVGRLRPFVRVDAGRATGAATGADGR